MATVWHISAIQFSNKTIVQGVVLKKNIKGKVVITNWLKNTIEIIKSYFRSAYTHQEICVTTNNHTLKTTTDNYGGFSVVFEFKVDEDIVVSIPTETNTLNIHQSYPVLFKDPSSSLNVISDIDDSIMVSYTKTRFKRFFTTLFKIAEKRDVISFTQDLFETLKSKNARFFYVSKSENNLFSLISTFISYNELPKGPLLLTPYLSAKQLIFDKKDKNFKLNKIKYIIENSNNEKFVLLGDDTQKDMEIYTLIAKEYASQILNVYIRKTQNTVSKTQRENWVALKATGVDAYYFGHNETFLKSN